MSGNKPIIYFDSCIWIALITQEQRKDPAETAAIAGLVSCMERKEFIVVSSSLIFAEVLESTLTDQQKQIFQGVTKRKTVVQIKDAARPIMDLCGEIRNFYRAQKQRDPEHTKIPSIPDAIHISTAIYYECTHFYTLDDGILSLANPIAGRYTLSMTRPSVIEPGFAV